MNRLSRVYTSLSNVLIVLATVCAPLAAKATTVATPVFSLAAGTYTGTETVTITDSTSGSKIYYTTNGSTPTTLSTLYSGAITVSSSETLEAMATATGDTQSATATAAYTILGTLQVYLSGPGVQSTSVAGAATETFDALSTTNPHTAAYVSTAGIGTYGSSTQQFAIEAPGEFGGATDSTHTAGTNYFAVGGDSGTTSPVYLTLTNPVSYFGFWWSAGDQYNTVALYSGSTLYGTFTTANLLTFLNHGTGTITANSGAIYSTSAYFGNPNITGTNDSTEPFAYISFVISGATINQIAFYNTNTSTSFESDNHSAIFSGNTVTIPTTFVPVESMSLGTQSVSVSVSPASANVKAGGTQQFTATVVGSTNTSVTWSISPATGAGTISSSGLYTAPATVTTPQTVTITATSAANTSVKAPVIVNLLATPTVSVWPTASGITYGQTLASSTLTGGTTSTPGTFTWTTPGTAPGVGTASQSVTFTPTASTSYSTVTGTVNVTVAKATPTVSAWPTASGITYGQTLASSTLTGGTASVAGTFAWTTPSTAPAAGTPSESVTFTPTASTNYTTVVGTVPVTVAKATPTVSVWPTASAITYGQTLASSPLTGGTASVAGTFAWTTPTTVPSAGTPSESVTFTPTASTNYATVPGTVSVTVGQGTPVITFTSANTVAYGTTLTVAATSTLGTPTFTEANGTGAATLSGSTLTPTGVGTVTITASVAATTNYKAGTAQQTVTITQGTPVITFTSANTVAYGTTLTVAATSTLGTPTFTEANGTGAATLSGSTLTPTGIGTVTITASVAATPNYKAATATQTVTITQGTPVITFTSANTVAYGTTLTVVATSTLGTPTFTEANGTGSATLSGSTLTPTGVGTVTITASVAATTNYKAGTAQQTVTITQGTPVITFTSANTVAYGTTLTVAATSTLGTPTFTEASGTGSATLSGSTLTPTGVGTVTITASVAATTNYKAGTAQQTVTITQATPTVSVWPTATALTYGQTLASSTLSGGTPSVAGTFAWTTPSTAPGVGTASQSVTFTPTSTNYTTAPGSVSVTVAPATPTVSAWPTASAITYGQTLASSTLSGGTASVAGTFAWTTPTTTPGAGTTSESVTFIPAVPANYNTVVGTVNVTVSAPPSYTLAASPTSLTVVQSGSGMSIIAVTGANGFSGSVTLAASGLPSGVTAAFATNPTTGSSVLTLTASGTATVGTAMVTVTGTSGSLTASTTVALTVTAPQCAANGYIYQRAIVIDHTKVPNTDQTNFPFLFNTIDPAFASTSNNGHVASQSGDDIIFSTDPNGFTKLDHELEEYNPQTGQVIAWVRIPTLSHTADTVLYMFYGNPSIGTPQQNPTGVWDSNFGGVWHLGGNGPVSSTGDSTANGNNGTVVGSISQTIGEIGNGIALSGSPNYIDAGNSASVLPTHTGTFSVWVNYNAFAEWTTPMGNGSGGSDTNGALFWNYPGGQVDFEVDGSGVMNRVAGSTLVTGQWYYLTGSWDGSTVNFYENGALVGNAAQTTDASPAYHLMLGVDGALSGSGYYLNGSLNEARVSGIARSPDWIATEYSNESSPATFYTFSPEGLDNTELVTPSTVSLYAAQNQQFAMLGVGTCSSVAVGWTISPVVGTISATGLYSAPATISAQQTVTITATNQANNTSASATVTLMSSSSGPAGTVVTINGAGFGSAEGASSVTVGGLPAVTLFWSDTQIQAQIPSGTGLGNQAVVVTIGGQAVTSTTFNVTSGLTGITPSAAGTPGAVTIDTPGQTAPLIFYGTQGQLVSVELNNTFSYSECATVTILDQNNSTVGSASTCNGQGFLFLSQVALPSTGDYTMVITPWENGTGSASFTIALINNLLGTITSGTPVPVTINTIGQEELLTFSGVKGQTAYLNISNSNFTCNPYSLSFFINNPDGSNLTGNSMCGSFGQVAPIVLPATGTYTVVVVPQNGSFGSANVNLWLFNNQVGTITSGTPVPVAINTPGQEDLLTFSGVGGQTAYLNISNSTFTGCYSLSLSINNPNGSNLTGNSMCGSSGSIGPLALPTTGTYTVVVAPQNSSTGSATVSLTLTLAYSAVNMSASLVPPESSLGSPVAVNLTLTANNRAEPPGTVSCAGAGVTSSQISVNPNGTAVVPMNGLPLGNDAIICSYVSIDPASFSNAVSFPVIESVAAAPVTGAVSVNPASVTLYAGQSQQFGASVFNTSNQAVTWSLPTGAPDTFGTLTASGLYTAPGSITSQQTVAITATGQGSGTSSGTAIVTLLPAPANPRLTLAATAQPPYVTGTSQTFAVTLTNQDGTPIANESVAFTVTGANNNTGSAITNSNGVATYAYTGANSGNDTIQTTASISGEQVISNKLSAVWIVPSQPIATTSVLGQFFFYDPLTDADGQMVFNTPPTAIPAFTEEFPNICFNPPSGTIPGNTTIGTGTHPFTDVTTDENGNFAGTIVAQGNGYQAGLNRQGNGPEGLIQNQGIFQGVFTGSYIVASAGDAVINVYVDNNFILGIGGGATSVSVNPPLGPGPATTPFEQLPVMGNSGYNNTIGGYSMTVHFPGPGTYPYELDYVECCGDGGGDTLSLMMSMGPIGGSGLPPAGALTITPSSLNPLPAGGQQAFTVQAIDASGNPVPNLNVTLEISGVDSQELKATTNASGSASFTYQDVNPGTASVQAVALIDGMVTFSSQVNVPWTLPPSASTGTGGSGTLAISITADSSVSLPNPLQLTGTATDSGLPTGSSPTMTWTGSGPGTVTFAPNPNQASVAATFSLPGSYIVELSASDSVPNSGSVQWPVTVTPPQQNLQGWIGAPTYGSAVSGVVPITVASGVTLQSGTLTYYSASNPNSVITLNANTTGSGQIGTLDTTTLVNGSYWIQLQAIDTSSQQQFSLVLVTVSGNYKAGRVTATVTDLVVPATGLAINIQRDYDSLNAGTSSDFGYGWSLGFNVNLAVDPVGNVTFTLGGQRKTFYLSPQPQTSSFGGETFEFWPWFLPAYTPEPGLHGTLTDGGSGCIALDWLTPNGNLWSCAGAGLYNPTTYVYTDPNGTAYTISASGNLQSIQDLSGNGLTITANGITSTTGLSVPFVRDPNNNNRITKITDPAGNIYQYGYDTNGNLLTVTYPVSVQSNSGCPGATASGTSTYTYDPTLIHLYAGGTDGRGCPLPTSTYYNSTTDNGNSALDGRLLSSTDAFSNTTSYAYDIPDLTTTITYPDNNHATMVYDSFGDLLTSTDPNNLTTTNVYDANHNLILVTDPLGHATTYTYDANGNKTSSTYPVTATSTNTTSYTYYNQYSEPTSTIDELGNVRFFNYDTNFLPQSVTDSIGTLASFVFNPNSTLASGAVGFDISVNPAQASQFTYDTNGNMASRTDALGRTTSYVYNSLGQKISMTAPTPTSPTGSAASTTAYDYDAMGNLTSTAAPLSRNTSSTYDANGNKLSDTDARGNTTNYKYDALNRLVETDYPTTPATKSTKTYDFRNNVIDEIDQAGNDTHHVYDPAGRQLSVTRGYGSSTTAPSTTHYTYYNDGRKATETDPANNVTNYYYDAAGRLTSVTGAQGTTTYTYDDAGNQISRADGKGNTTQLQYDARKRLIKTTYPDTTTTINAYDGPGNLASVTDQNQNVVQYTYDAANQLKTVVQVNSPNAPANTNQYGYDPLGNLATLTDENTHTTQNLFDQYGEPTQKTLPASQIEARTYDGAGNLYQLTHFNGKTTTYTYDALNRLLSRSTSGEPSDTVSFTYTATGKYLTSTAQDGTVNYTYDALDRLTTKATPEGTLSYTYFPTGKVETIASSNPHGVSAAYTWDDQNRLSTVVDGNLSGQNTTTYTYDSASNLVTAAYPNNLTSTYTYDALNRLTELSTSTSPVADYKYTLGATGIRTNATEQSGRTMTWNYDNIYRLTGETIAGDPANNNGDNGSASYTLDPVGNRTAAASTLSGINPVAGAYNANDQLSSETYDANGNTTRTANGNSYTYDSENHMVSMTNGSAVVTMIYDAFGNRVAKTVNNVTTQYLVEDDVNPTGYPQVVEELTGSIGSGVVTRQYTYGLQRISENLSPTVTGNSTWTPSFYGYDGFGSVRQLTNSSGTVTDSYEYDAFGNSFTKTGTTPNNYLYRGEQYDSDLALYYLRARYYNPNTGRFLSRDPEDGKPIDPKTLHKYLYVGGNPVNWIDPRGREIVEVAEEESEEDVAATKEAREAGIRLAGCFFGIAWTIGEIADENWKEALGAGIPTAFACYEFLLPEPPMPPVVPPPAFPPPPPPPGLPPNWCGLECWNPPPGTPIN